MGDSAAAFATTGARCRGIKGFVLAGKLRHGKGTGASQWQGSELSAVLQHKHFVYQVVLPQGWQGWIFLLSTLVLWGVLNISYVMISSTGAVPGPAYQPLCWQGGVGERL